MSGGVTDEFAGVTPQLIVPDTAAAVEFYRQAFGADELRRNELPDGRVMLSELLVCGGRLLVHDEFAESGAVTPERLGGSPVTLHLYVADVDEVFARAVRLGATPLMEPQDAFWGDRYAQVLDPSGHRWSFGQKLEDLAPDEINERGRAYLRDRADPEHPH
ncbi:VOC family protein [Sphaerisporangium flaviroseum]|uniref:VOC family protein n=1 Tax=Sphaerisporangium flaviroseum TaxID=509199 RepID=A0ABP7HPL8_9ACTN